MSLPTHHATLSSPSGSITLGWQPRRRSFRAGSNEWLKVRGHITAPEGTWDFTDQCLTITEVATLANWLRDLASGAAHPSQLEFLEPNLTFAAAETPQQPTSHITVRIRFRGECAPPWLAHDPDAVWSEGFWLELHTRPDQLRSFALSLDRLING